MRFTSLPDAISSLEIPSGSLETRFTSVPDTISSLEIPSGSLETRFTSLPGTISSLEIASGPLETRSALRAARCALVAGGSASLETGVSIYPPLAPMPVADDLWKQLVDEAGEDAVDSAAGVSASEAERDLKAAGFDTSAERAKAEGAIAVLTGPGGTPKEEADAAREGQGWVSAPAPPARGARSSSRVVWLVAALVAAATAGGIVYGLARRSKPPDAPPEPPGPAPTASAAPPPAPEPSPPARAAPAEGPDPFPKAPAAPRGGTP